MNTQIEIQTRLFASGKSWIEGEAVRQFHAAAGLEGMRVAAGFPDLHPGKGGPVGAAFVTEGMIYPYLIGGDIGCGMALFKTDLVQRDMKLSRWAELAFDLEHPWEGDVRETLAAAGLEATEFDEGLGTIGGGNHFAELQCVQVVVDAKAFKEFGLAKQQLVALVHSGSRGLGESTLRAHVSQHRNDGVVAGLADGVAYLKGHDHAVCWAKTNRALIARRFAEALGAEAELLWDGCHNSITRREENGETAWVHRKGAVAAENGPVMIPGTRGTPSYLVKPTGDAAGRAWSLAHGAGRKFTRSEARARMRERFGRQQLTQTPLGGRVICEQRELLYEEAPAAYKNIEDVIRDLAEAGLAEVVATFRPVLTYKTRTLKR